MSEYRILVFVGSLHAGSFNQALAEVVAKLSAPGFTFRRAEIGALPLYSQDEDVSGRASSVRRWHVRCGDGTAASEERSRLSGYAGAQSAGGVHPGDRRLVRRPPLKMQTTSERDQ